MTPEDQREAAIVRMRFWALELINAYQKADLHVHVPLDTNCPVCNLSRAIIDFDDAGKR